MHSSSSLACTGSPAGPALRSHLDVVGERSFTPLPEEAKLSDADAFVVAACLDYAEHGPRPEVRIATAHRMLAENPRWPKVRSRRSQPSATMQHCEPFSIPTLTRSTGHAARTGIDDSRPLDNP